MNILLDTVYLAGDQSITVYPAHHLSFPRNLEIGTEISIQKATPIRALKGKLLKRDNLFTTVSFEVDRLFTSDYDARNFVLIQAATLRDINGRIGNTGIIRFNTIVNGQSSNRTMNGYLASCRTRHVGVTVICSYRLEGDIIV